MKILFTDMDGTLLNDNKQISTETKSCIETMISKGNQLVLSSGRPLESIIESAASIGLLTNQLYIIAYNGGLIYDCGQQKIIYEQTLSPSETSLIFTEAQKLGIHAQTYTSTHIICKQHTPELDYYRRLVPLPFIITDDIISALPKQPYKVLAVHLNDKLLLNKLQNTVLEVSNSMITPVFSNDRYLEFFSKSSGKGNAARFLMDFLKVPIAHTAGIGDADNDISMLQAVGYPVAMCNGSKEVKKNASYITLEDNNHNGIIELIKNFF